MPELLKDVYSETYIEQLARSIRLQLPSFDIGVFKQLVFDATWPQRELKARMRHISTCLQETMQLPYEDAMQVLCKAAPGFSGYEAMFFPDYVEQYGTQAWSSSVRALEWLTRFSSSEFAVRVFILAEPEKMMQQMLQWAQHESEHVRRLASEGCRPRLPWAQALPAFKQDPALILPILEQLKNDPSEYVRRSVANNLNDIAKDNPEVTIVWAEQNLGEQRHTDWIIKHGCRTLLKQAHPQVMQLFGYHSASDVEVKALMLVTGEISIGENLSFNFELTTQSADLGKLRIEYEIDYLKANGKYSAKVFKVADGDFKQPHKSYRLKQSFRQMTTRKHHPGLHRLRIKVNGEVKACKEFTLQP